MTEEMNLLVVNKLQYQQNFDRYIDIGTDGLHFDFDYIDGNRCDVNEVLFKTM